ncbi:MAG: DUF58 domain-containing protein [Polyangiaceae bacterium]|nr:DUF58 domain-containing protein [Polyangiaceae bacterium]
MQVYPTRTAAHLVVASVAVAAVGLVAESPAIVGWGGGILLAVVVARAVTLVSVARIRAAGFEMLWTGPKRVVRSVRGGTIEIEAEVRNRDSRAARYVKLRAIASSQVDIKLEPPAGEVAANGKLRVKVTVRTPRVGQHGVHGLALEVHGAPGLFEVPLTFANPYGIEVVPRPLATYAMQARGGRSRLSAAVGRPGRARGDGSDLRELREHQPGDPFRRIAWKASARRGMLLVRDFEREERDVVWIVLDANVQHWAGPVGRAPLDYMIDEAAAVANRHLGRGDRVGLYLYATTARVFLNPEDGPAQGSKIAHALVVGTSTHDFDRSDLDESDVAVRVIEHLRPLDSRGLNDVRRGDLDKLAQRADQTRSRAPFSAAAPAGRTPRERTLRRYLAAYGIESPPRSEQVRQGGLALFEVFHAIERTKPHATLVHVIGQPPEEQHDKRLGDAVRRLSRHGAQIVWSLPEVVESVRGPWDDPQKPTNVAALPDLGEEDPPAPLRPTDFPTVAPIAAEAVAARVRAAHARRETALRKLGIRVVHAKKVQRAMAAEGAPPEGDAPSAAPAPNASAAPDATSGPGALTG